jgi:hypothetical protein
MAAQCFPLVGGRVMRVTRLDGCGRPDNSQPDNAQVTSDGFVSIEVTANVEEGDAISVTNAAGKVCISQTPCPTLTGYSVNITFCNVDPDLFAMVTGQDSVLDPASGDGIGFRVNTGKSGCDSGFALEVWSSVPGVSCPVDENGDPIPEAESASGYILFPFLQGGVFGDFTIENDAVSFVIQGAGTKDGSGWGFGPYDVTLDAGGDPGPLTDRIDSKDHLHVQVTYVAPPEPSCGAGPLVPVTAATGATAGTPGTFTPADSTAPANAAGATAAGLTASPTTAWTTGQYVQGSTAGAGGEFYWDGDSWEAGRAA